MPFLLKLDRKINNAFWVDFIFIDRNSSNLILCNREQSPSKVFYYICGYVSNNFIHNDTQQKVLWFSEPWSSDITNQKSSKKQNYKAPITHPIG